MKFFYIPRMLARMAGFWPVDRVFQFWIFKWKNIYLSYLFQVNAIAFLIQDLFRQPMMPHPEENGLQYGSRMFFRLGNTLSIVKCIFFPMSMNKFQLFLTKLREWFDEGDAIRLKIFPVENNTNCN